MIDIAQATSSSNHYKHDSARITGHISNNNVLDVASEVGCGEGMVQPMSDG